MRLSGYLHVTRAPANSLKLRFLMAMLIYRTISAPLSEALVENLIVEIKNSFTRFLSVSGSPQTLFGIPIWDELNSFDGVAIRTFKYKSLKISFLF